MSFQFLQNCFNNDVKRLRSIKRFFFYTQQPYDFYRLQGTRKEMLNIIIEDKESVKQTAGNTTWVLYLKRRQKQKTSWFW